MKKLIEDKIESHIKAILSMDTIGYSEYLTLVSYLERLEEKEQEREWDPGEVESVEHVSSIFKAILK